MARRNPDEEIRMAARRYLTTRDPADKQYLVNLQIRAGLTCQAEWTHPGSLYLVSDYCDYCGAFVCDLCKSDHHQPLPEKFSNQCVECKRPFTDEHPCWSSKRSSSCFQHFHEEGYCRTCWQAALDSIVAAHDDWEPNNQAFDPDYDDYLPYYDDL